MRLLLQAGDAGQSPLPLFPEQASTMAPRIDGLYWFLVGITGFFTLLIFGLVLLFALRYRRRAGDAAPPEIHGNLLMEIVWTGIPLVLSMVIFGWGATLYFDVRRAPANAVPMEVVAKQWMWKLQHPEGHREINELHIPVGRPVELRMISEDVIHSFFVPAFRVKQDVLPGRYSTLWFEATRPGSYHLFCAEYCGTKHAEMIGRVVVMEPVDYQAWLSGRPAGETPAQSGQKLFTQLGCGTCHQAVENQQAPSQRGPVLRGVFGKRVQFADGASAVADEDYLRESILRPMKRIVAGYEAIMPTYEGQVSEEGILQLIAYIKSLAAAEDKK